MVSFKELLNLFYLASQISNNEYISMKFEKPDVDLWDKMAGSDLKSKLLRFFCHC